MFRSFQFNDYLKHTDDGGEYIFSYKIVDDDFVDVGITSSPTFMYEVVNAVINTYTKLGLPVAPNIVAGVMFQCTPMFQWPSRLIFSENAKSNERFQPYKDEVAKYIVLV